MLNPNSLANSKAVLEPVDKRIVSYLISIRKEVDPDWNGNHPMDFETRKVAQRVERFRINQHADTHRELVDAWEQDREEQEHSKSLSEDVDVIPNADSLVAVASVEQPDTAEAIIMDRHVFELLYYLMLISHHKMKLRKDTLIDDLIATDPRHRGKSTAADREVQRFKKSQLIQSRLPTHHEAIKSDIKSIFKKVVVKHYQQCAVFVKLKRKTICKFIQKCCILAFEMLLAYSSEKEVNLSYTAKGQKTEHTELSFFPLLFTNRESSYICPVVEWHEKIVPKERHRLRTLVRVWQSHPADKDFEEQKHDRGHHAASRAQHILYYMFPAVMVSRTDQLLEKPVVFCHDDPELFLRHDLNWIFSDSSKRGDALRRFAVNEEILPIEYQAFMSAAELLAQWAAFKEHQYEQLLGAVCAFMTRASDCDGDEDEDDSKMELEFSPYKCKRIASRFIWSLTLRCWKVMRRETAKLKDAQFKKHMLPFLNMKALHQFLMDHPERSTHRHVRRVMNPLEEILESIFDGDGDGDGGNVDSVRQHGPLEFVETDKNLRGKLYEYAAYCCELMTHLCDHRWEIFPVEQGSDRAFDVEQHTKDSLNDDGIGVVDWFVFPGIRECATDMVKQKAWVRVSGIAAVKYKLKCLSAEAEQLSI